MGKTAPEAQVETRTVHVCHIFISPEHNFKGHHGGPAGTTPMESLTEAPCEAGKGIPGDRFYDHKDNFKGQITFFSWEVLERMREELRVPNLKPDALRRNIIIDGVDLNALIGKRFEINGVEFEGSEECAPCYWMNGAVGSGAEAFMRGRGGLRARILNDGVLTTGTSTLRIINE